MILLEEDSNGNNLKKDIARGRKRLPATRLPPEQHRLETPPAPSHRRLPLSSDPVFTDFCEAGIGITESITLYFY